MENLGYCVEKDCRAAREMSEEATAVVQTRVSVAQTREVVVGYEHQIDSNVGGNYWGN